MISISDDLAASIVANGKAVEAAQAGPLNYSNVIVVDVQSASSFGGPPYNVTLRPATAKDTSQDTVINIGILPKLMVAPSNLPQNITYQPGDGSKYGQVTSDTSNVIQIEDALIMAIKPSTDGKQSEIDLYLTATNSLQQLHVASVPSGLTTLDGKKWSMGVIFGVGGVLDEIVDIPTST
jgi:hypothetical protein